MVNGDLYIGSLFKGITSQEFDERFGTEEKCLEFLAGKKWGDSFICRKCGNANYCRGRSPFSRRCTRCKHEESATAHTLFHHCRMPMVEAFRIAFLVCNHPDISTYELSRTVNTRQMTCWKFKKKVTECLSNTSPFTRPIGLLL